MKHLAPAVFRRFVCAAGSCPDSCCRAGWEIVVDPETLARYHSLPGPEGARVRSAVRPGQEPLLRQDEARACVLLDEDGLCFAQRRFGHESLCRVCREYPRFHREFGNLTEHGLSLSCPRAYALAVSEPPSLEQWEDGAPVVPNDLDPERYLLLREGRTLALRILGQEDRPLRDRLELVWALADRLQYALDGQRRAGKAALRRLASPIGQKAALRRARRFSRALPCPGGRGQHLVPARAETLYRWAQTFSGLELLSPVWKDALGRFSALAEAGRLPAEVPEPDRPEEYARWLWYSLFKYWLDAADDGRLLPRVRRSFVMTLLGLAMDSALPGEGPFLRRISREIEHCEENLEALLQR